MTMKSPTLKPIQVVKGLYCLKCGHTMYAQEEQQVGPNRWKVYYICENQECRHITHIYE